MPQRSDAGTMTRRSVLAVLLATPIAWAAPLSAQGQGSVEGIASQLICQCGCGKLLNVCEMDTAKQMRSIISDKLAQGWEAGAIITYMTDTYGEKVLAAPPKRGFNLTAWITPFAVIFAGAGLVAIVVALWTRRRPAPVGAGAPEVLDALEARYGALLDRELDDIER